MRINCYFFQFYCLKLILHERTLSHVYTHTYILVYTILCKLEYDVFEIRSDEHITTGYLNVMADVRCYNWRASEASETLSGVYKFELVRYIYIYIYIYVWRYVCHNSSACHAYVIWAELVHCHF